MHSTNAKCAFLANFKKSGGNIKAQFRVLHGEEENSLTGTLLFSSLPLRGFSEDLPQPRFRLTVESTTAKKKREKNHSRELKVNLSAVK